MPSELQQVNDGVERGEYCHQQPALQPRAVAQLLAWLNERYPLPSFTSPDKSIWASGTRYCTKVFTGYRRHGNRGAGKYL